jgi:hypothetical protein
MKGICGMSFTPRMCAVGSRVTGKTEVGKSKSDATRETMICTAPTMTILPNVVHPDAGTQEGSNRSLVT